MLDQLEIGVIAAQGKASKVFEMVSRGRSSAAGRPVARPDPMHTARETGRWKKLLAERRAAEARP